MGSVADLLEQVRDADGTGPAGSPDHTGTTGVNMSHTTTFSLGDMVSIDAKVDNVGKVLDMRTRHEALEYLIEHPGHTHPGSIPRIMATLSGSLLIGSSWPKTCGRHRRPTPRTCSRPGRRVAYDGPGHRRGSTPLLGQGGRGPHEASAVRRLAGTGWHGACKQCTWLKGTPQPCPQQAGAWLPWSLQISVMTQASFSGSLSANGSWGLGATTEYALRTETWREHVARRQRHEEVRGKLVDGQVHGIDDLITLNLDICRFAQDAIESAEGPELLRAFWRALESVTVLDPTCGSGASCSPR